jgi:diguanylate cyclase (GGDEF)-like protein
MKKSIRIIGIISIVVLIGLFKDEINLFNIILISLFFFYLIAVNKFYNIRLKEEANNLTDLNNQLKSQNNLLELNNEALKILLEIRKMISISQDIDSILDMISQSCSEKLNVKPGIFLISPETKELELKSKNQFEIINEKYRKIKFSQDFILWKAIENEEPLYFKNFEFNEYCDDLININAEDNLACYIVPIIINSERIGVVIYLFDNSVEEFSQIVLNLSPLLTQEITAAIRDSKTYSKIVEKAEKDELTDMYNYRYLMNKLKFMFEESKEGLYSLGVVMIDINDFKYINDTKGHLFGNKILREVADSIKKSIRDNDIAGRYGGDEFIIIMSGVNKDKIDDVTDRLFDSINNNKLIPDNISISVGGAVLKDSIKDYKQLLIEADEAMYEVKNAHRNLHKNIKKIK